MFDIPGIINPNKQTNADEIIVTDEFGEFELQLTPAFYGIDVPKVEVLISMENLRDVQRVLYDRAGILSDVRVLTGGQRAVFWGNKARAPHGFLLRRGSYTLRAYINGRESMVKKVVSRTHPYREDWQDFTWLNEFIATTPSTSSCINAGEYQED